MPSVSESSVERWGSGGRGKHHNENQGCQILRRQHITRVAHLADLGRQQQSQGRVEHGGVEEEGSAQVGSQPVLTDSRHLCRRRLLFQPTAHHPPPQETLKESVGGDSTVSISNHCSLAEFPCT